MQQADNETILDMDSILDSTLDAVADVPDYVTPPTGNYVLGIHSAELKKGLPAKGDKAATAPRLAITYRIDEVKETDALPPAVGALFSEGFQATEQGLEYFKKQVKKILNVDSVDGISIRDMLTTLPEVSPFLAQIKTSKNKDGYENCRITPVHS